MTLAQLLGYAWSLFNQEITVEGFTFSFAQVALAVAVLGVVVWFLREVFLDG